MPQQHPAILVASHFHLGSEGGLGQVAQRGVAAPQDIDTATKLGLTSACVKAMAALTAAKTRRPSEQA